MIPNCSCARIEPLLLLHAGAAELRWAAAQPQQARQQPQSPLLPPLALAGGLEPVLVGGLEPVLVGGLEPVVLGGLEPVLVGGLEPVVQGDVEPVPAATPHAFFSRLPQPRVARSRCAAYQQPWLCRLTGEKKEQRHRLASCHRISRRPNHPRA